MKIYIRKCIVVSDAIMTKSSDMSALYGYANRGGDRRLLRKVQQIAEPLSAATSVLDIACSPLQLTPGDSERWRACDRAVSSISSSEKLLPSKLQPGPSTKGVTIVASAGE